jgi:hypothetical protein
MGCGSSRASSALNTIDDSRHVMLIRDLKVKQKELGQGTEAPSFKPRAEHILLKAKIINTNTNGNANGYDNDNPAAPTSTTKTLIDDLSDSKDE